LVDCINFRFAMTIKTIIITSMCAKINYHLFVGEILKSLNYHSGSVVQIKLIVKLFITVSAKICYQSL